MAVVLSYWLFAHGLHALVARGHASLLGLRLWICHVSQHHAGQSHPDGSISTRDRCDAVRRRTFFGAIHWGAEPRCFDVLLAIGLGHGCRCCGYVWLGMVLRESHIETPSLMKSADLNLLHDTRI